MTDGVIKRLDVPTAAAMGGVDLSNVERAVNNLASTLYGKNFSIQVNVPEIKIPPIRVEPMTAPAPLAHLDIPAPQVHIEPQIKIEPASVFVKGLEPKDVFIAASIVAIPLFLDLAIRIIMG